MHEFPQGDFGHCYTTESTDVHGLNTLLNRAFSPHQRSSASTVSKGFCIAANDVKASQKLLVAAVDSVFAMRDEVEVMNPQIAGDLVAVQA